MSWLFRLLIVVIFRYTRINYDEYSSRSSFFPQAWPMSCLRLCSLSDPHAHEPQQPSRKVPVVRAPKETIIRYTLLDCCSHSMPWEKLENIWKFLFASHGVTLAEKMYVICKRLPAVTNAVCLFKMQNCACLSSATVLGNTWIEMELFVVFIVGAMIVSVMIWSASSLLKNN